MDASVEVLWTGNWVSRVRRKTEMEVPAETSDKMSEKAAAGGEEAQRGCHTVICQRGGYCVRNGSGGGLKTQRIPEARPETAW